MRIKNFKLTLLILIIGLLLAACSSNGNSNDNNAAGNNDNNNNNDSEAVAGGEINIAYNAQPPTLDAHLAGLISTRDIAKNIYETLITVNSKGEIQPMLAESFEQSDDGSVVTFNLREGIKFHNGEEMTAEDVVVSMERWQEISSQAKSYLANTTYEEIDTYTVEAHIEKPSTLDLYIFADMSQFSAIMPKDIVENAGADGVDEFIGTGPFQLEEWKSDQYIQLTKFDDYQARSEPADGLAGEKLALVDDLYFHFVEDSSTRVAGIQTGEYDIANLIPQDNAEMLESDPNINNLVPFDSFLNIIFNKKEGIFTDIKARQAVNAAINTEEILAAAYKIDKFYINDHSLVQEEVTDWYSNEGKETHDLYDPELAKELLAESDYDGEEIKILTSRDYEDRYNAAVVLQQSLKEVGFNAELNVMDGPTYAEAINDSEHFDLYFSRFLFRQNPMQYLFFIPDYSGWTDSKEIQGAIDEILYSDTLEEAYQHSATLHQETWDYLPIIKVGNVTDVTAVYDHIEGLDFLFGPNMWNVSTTDN